MGQKTHPVGFRLAVRRNWQSRWFARKKDFAKLLHEDQVIRETLMDLDKRYGYVVVDAAGRDSRELRTGMTAAHVLVVPFRPSQPDLDTLPKMQEIITQARDLNPDLIVKGLLTMASGGARSTEATVAISAGAGAMLTCVSDCARTVPSPATSSRRMWEAPLCAGSCSDKPPISSGRRLHPPSP